MNRPQGGQTYPVRRVEVLLVAPAPREASLDALVLPVRFAARPPCGPGRAGVPARDLLRRAGSVAPATGPAPSERSRRDKLEASRDPRGVLAAALAVFVGLVDCVFSGLLTSLAAWAPMALTIAWASRSMTSHRAAVPRVAHTSGISASPSSPNRSCTHHLPLVGSHILAHSVTRSVDQAIGYNPQVLKVAQRPQHLARQQRRISRPEVGPRRRDQGTGAIWEHQYQIQTALAPHPAENPQRLAQKWVTFTDNRHLRREVLQVGSLSPSRSTRSTIPLL